MEYKWKAFTVVALSLFVMVMDASALNVILPQIAEDFEVSLGTVSWVTIIGYANCAGIIVWLQFVGAWIALGL